MPFLSIIVPVYHVEKYIDQCVKSILAQEFTDYECILVDDGSKDACSAICDSYAATDSRITVIHKENGGLVSARQAGIRAARGIYVGYVDADDFIHPSMYAKLCAMAVETGADIVSCDCKSYCDGDDLEVGSGDLPFDGYYEGESYKKEILSKSLYSGTFFSFGIPPAVWMKIYKRELFLSHQLEVDTKIVLGEDAACSYFAYLEASSAGFVNEQLYYYRNNPQSITRKRDAEKYKKTMSLLDFMWAKTKRYEAPQFTQQFFYYAVHMMTNIVYDHLRTGEDKEHLEELFSIYESMAMSDSGQEVLKRYEGLMLPGPIKAYMDVIKNRDKKSVRKANRERVLAGLLRRLRK